MADSKHEGTGLMAGDSGWHLRKEVSIGHILTTATVLSGLAVYIANAEARLATLEAHRSHLEERLNREDQRNAELFADIRQALVRIEAKLDRKEDKR